ncbi:hypothetical protein B0I32_13293 [Nonomuraea fuscirosea]|uniref:Uncharacterized protein n=1 Tax=Nonomuraea fuscirosea TaxID=1291556 RepID=A0A2T0M557_9ACTN|nr:hypothetical protein [Nonomuraea fuscirosea]PRX52343.1 hypothetical protein B0I32_13293 [Nonomuraea fuscirosea]
MDIPPASTPIVCDMTTAPDTPQERLDEYRHLFAEHLIGRERTTQGIRFRLNAEPGVAAWVRDLAAREQACCAFFAFDVAVEGDEVIWDCAVSDDDTARALLEEYYLLPDLAHQSPEALEHHLAAKGLHFTTDPAHPHRHPPAQHPDGSPDGA